MVLRCGSKWRPNNVTRCVERYPTSTNVSFVDTDQGLGFLKGPSPAGDQALACELLGTELAGWIGLPTFDFSTITINRDLYPDSIQNDLESPFLTGYITKNEKELMIWDGHSEILELTKNRECISGLVVFDTWIMNFDRCGPDPNIHEIKRDNYAFVPVGRRKYNILAIDHTHILTEGDLWLDIFDPEFAITDDIYGLPEAFKPYVNHRSAKPFLEKLRNIDVDEISEIVRSIPANWGNTGARTEKLIECLCNRAQHVVENLPGKIFDDADLFDWKEG
ncbi:MAG: hypothetical protein KTR23_01225 [Rhodospirillales bacterium]|nr:hypothetical protein [Rhodospirillales bacterium]